MLCEKCNKTVYSEQIEQIFCDKCLKIIKTTEPFYKINVILNDRTSIEIGIKPNSTTFESIFKQIKKHNVNKESITHKTHSLIFNGRNMTRVNGSDNVFIKNIKENDKLYFITNDIVNLTINKLNGDSLSIIMTINMTVSEMIYEIEKKYKIPRDLQNIFLNDIKLHYSKALYYYNISNDTNNILSLVVKQDDIYTSEYIMLRTDYITEYMETNMITHTHFNLLEFEISLLQKARSEGIEPYINEARSESEGIEPYIINLNF